MVFGFFPNIKSSDPTDRYHAEMLAKLHAFFKNLNYLGFDVDVKEFAVLVALF